MRIPDSLIGKLYNYGSLKNIADGVEFSLKNRLSRALLVGISSLMIGKKSIPIDRISLILRDKKLSPGEISDKNPLPFEMGEKMEIKAKTEPIDENGSCPISVLI